MSSIPYPLNINQNLEEERDAQREALAAAYDRLVQEALSRLIDAKLADVGAWED